MKKLARQKGLFLAVTLGVSGLPLPGASAHLIHTTGCFPSELFESLVRFADDGGQISRAAIDDLVRNLLASCFFEALDHFEHGAAVARAQIVHEANSAFGSSTVKHFLKNNEFCYMMRETCL